MQPRDTGAPAAGLTGRIQSGPAEILRRDVLDPQFRYEAEHLLGYYVQVEKVLLLEYQRMGFLTARQVTAVARALDEATAERLAADLDASMSDISFGLERFVLSRLDEPIPVWHVDRSRNDLQACAQVMLGREMTLLAATALAECGEAALRRVGEYTRDVMPGYTHLQAAQVVTPGFYLAGVAERLLRALSRLDDVYTGLDVCPLGSGAMSGQELDWDRSRMSALLGFAGAEPHALTAVASREWLLDLAAACSTTGVVVSRFATDLMTWSSGAYEFCELPDELSGISSAMPQKKNYPVLERIRGRTAHLTAWYVDVATTQRAVSYGNTVEVSKEGSAQLQAAMSAFCSALGLLRVVLDNIRFRADRMRAACEHEFLGGFSLANRLTLNHGVPWRTAQVIAGRYITAALEAGRRPAEQRPDLLAAVAGQCGYPLADPATPLRGVFDPDAELTRRGSEGSAAPDAVLSLRDNQLKSLALMTERWRKRRATIEAARHQADRMIASGTV